MPRKEHRQGLRHPQPCAANRSPGRLIVSRKKVERAPVGMLYNFEVFFDRMIF
jgi:hypothetical protein